MKVSSPGLSFSKTALGAVRAKTARLESAELHAAAALAQQMLNTPVQRRDYQEGTLTITVLSGSSTAGSIGNPYVRRGAMRSCAAAGKRTRRM